MYTYKIESCSRTTMEEILNSTAAQGWELSHVLERPSHILLIFRMPVEQKPAVAIPDGGATKSRRSKLPVNLAAPEVPEEA